MKNMPTLPGDIREAVLFRVQDVNRVLEEIEELLCLSEEEEKKLEKQRKKGSK